MEWSPGLNPHRCNSFINEHFFEEGKKIFDTRQNFHLIFTLAVKWSLCEPLEKKDGRRQIWTVIRNGCGVKDER